MLLFRISIEGEHKSKVQQTFYGLASTPQEAMALAMVAAAQDGWTRGRVTEAYEVGVLAFEEGKL